MILDSICDRAAIIDHFYSISLLHGYRMTDPRSTDEVIREKAGHSVDSVTQVIVGE